MSEAMSERWYTSLSEEWFSNGPFSSRDEAISEGTHCWEGKPFWVGKAGEYDPFERDMVEDLLEQEACSIGDSCGPDASDSWPPTIDREEAKAANERIREILVELTGPCHVFPIDNAEKVTPLGPPVPPEATSEACNDTQS